MALTTVGVTGVEFASTGDFYNYILRDHFLDAIADTVINPNVLYMQLESRSDMVEGKNVVHPIHTGRNRGVNSIGPQGNLPDPQKQAYNQYSYPTRGLYGRMLFDGIVDHASKTRIDSWLNAIESEARGLASDIRRELNRQLHNDGSGRLCQINDATPTGATITVELNPGIEDQASAVGQMPATNYIKVGDVIASVKADGTFHEARVVTAVTDTTITVSAVFTGATEDDDYIVRCSSSASIDTEDTGFQNETAGLASIYSDGNPADGVIGFQGVDATLAANSWNRAQIFSNGGTPRALTERLMQHALNQGRKNAEASFELMLASFETVQTYADLLVNDKRYVNTTELQGGYTAITFNKIPFIEDRDAYPNRIYFVDRSNLMRHVLAEPQWIDEDGSVYARMENKHKFQAALYCWETLGVFVRDKCVLLTDLIEVTA